MKNSQTEALLFTNEGWYFGDFRLDELMKIFEITTRGEEEIKVTVESETATLIADHILILLDDYDVLRRWVPTANPTSQPF